MHFASRGRAVFVFQLDPIQTAVRFTAVIEVSKRRLRFERQVASEVDAVFGTVLRIVNDSAAYDADVGPAANHLASEHAAPIGGFSHSNQRHGGRHQELAFSNRFSKTRLGQPRHNGAPFGGVRTVSLKVTASMLGAIGDHSASGEPRGPMVLTLIDSEE